MIHILERHTLQKDEYIKAYRTLRPELLRYAFGKLTDKALCEDLVQDTFVKTWVYITQGQQITNMRAFLYRVLYCLIVDEYRKHKYVSLDALLSEGFDPSEEKEEGMYKLDEKKALTLIPQLPSKYQHVLQLKFVKDLSLHEISLITGQPKNVVAVQIHRGVEKLSSLFSKN